jgi:hypothetical protein
VEVARVVVARVVARWRRGRARRRGPAQGVIARRTDIDPTTLPVAGEGRITKGGAGASDTSPSATALMGCVKAPWTGAVCMKQSAILAAIDSGDDVDMDAPPDALATHPDEKDRGLESLQDAVRTKKRLFVCGLALDFCVLDTCINAVALGFESVHIVLDAARAAHIPGFGQFGTGFLSDPKEVFDKFRAAGVIVTNTASTTANFAVKSVREVAKLPFPASLGPLNVAPAKRVTIQMEQEGRTYRVDLTGPLNLLTKFGFKNEGRCSPKSPIPARWPGAPEGVASICWAYPMEGMAALERRSRLAFLSVTSSVELCFAAYGGFLFLSGRGEVLGVQGLVAGDGHDDQLIFGAPQTWRREFTDTLSSAGRFQPVTLPVLVRAGAKEFCWINPGEEIVAGAERWTPSEHGAFLYMMGDDHPHVYYPMEDPRLRNGSTASNPARAAASENDMTVKPAFAPSTNAYYRDKKASMESALSEAVHAAISIKAPQPVNFMGNKLLEIADRSK